MTRTAYRVTGMTCEHCVNAVAEELRNLDGVRGVRVALVPDGESVVTVDSGNLLADEAVAAALGEAGAYHLAGA